MKIAAAIVGAFAACQAVFGPVAGALSNKSNGLTVVALLLYAASVRRASMFVLALVLFLANTRLLGSTDTVPNTFVPFAIVEHGTLALDAYPEAKTVGGVRQPCVRDEGDHVVSCAAIMVAVLATPIFAPAAIVTDASNAEHRRLLEKLAAAVIAAMTVWLVWRATASWIVFAAGTSMITVASQALWQHTGAAFGFALAMYGLFTKRSAWIVGVGCAVAVASRHIALIAVPGVLVALFLSRRRVQDVLVACFAALPFALALLMYNRHYFGGAMSTGYGDVSDLFTLSAERFFGFLVSPGRGLLVYTPVLAFAFVALARHDGRTRALLASLVIYSVALGSWVYWDGAWSPGPRLFTDVLPLAAVGLAHVPWSRVFAGAAVYSIVLHVWLAYVPPPLRTRDLHWDLKEGAFSAASYAPAAYVVGFMDPAGRQR